MRRSHASHRTICVLIIAIYCSIGAPARATMVSPTSLATMTNEAHVIFIGTCRARETALKPTSIGATIPVSHYTFDVHEVLKGELTTASGFAFEQVGGTVPGASTNRSALQPRGLEPYEVGKEYLLFLKKLSSGWWTPVGMMQGQFSVTTGPDGKKVVKNGVNNVSLDVPATSTASTGKGATTGVGGSNAGDLTYDVLKSLVKGYQTTPRP